MRAMFGEDAQKEQVNIDNAGQKDHNSLVDGGDEHGKQGTELDGTAEQGVWAGQAREPFAGAGIDRQGDLPASGVIRLSEQSRIALAKRGVEAVGVESTEDSAAFSLLLGKARSEDTANGWAVTPKDSGDLTGHKMFLAKDGGVGFAIAEDGDIQAVFRSKKRHPGKQAMRSVLPQAIAAVAPHARARIDPLVRAMLGDDRTGTQERAVGDAGPYGQDGTGRADYTATQAGAEMPAVSPQDGAGARLDGEAGVDTTTGQNSAQGAQERDPLMTALFGEESTQSSTPADVENGTEFDIAGENGYNESKRSKEASLVIDRLNSGERVDVKEIMCIPEVAIAEQANKGTPTIDLPGRETIRNNAFNQAMQTGSFTGKDYSGPVKQERRMDIVIGLPGSGKSSVYTERISQENGSRVIDTDDYRGYIPEYNGINAAIVHEEASSIKDQVLDAALDRGDNIILPTIGANADRLAAQIKAYAADGYSVYLHLNELPGHKAMARAISRFIGGNGELGRFVSPELISSYGDKPTQTYLILTGQGGSYGEDLDAGLPGGRGSGGTENTGDAQTQGRKAGYAEGLTGWDWYNNDVEYGQPPKLIQSSDKGELSGTQAPTQESGHTNTVGAAEADFLTPGSRSVERVSNIASGAAEFTGREGEATGLERADYDKLFRYQTETEAQRRQQATNLLYFNKDGQRAFLGDFDPESYQELVDYLTNAPAWNGIMTETAMMIKSEMQGRAMFDPMFQVPEGGLGVTQEDYTAWLQVMREHATETGRGLLGTGKGVDKLAERRSRPRTRTTPRSRRTSWPSSMFCGMGNGSFS